MIMTSSSFSSWAGFPLPLALRPSLPFRMKFKVFIIKKKEDLSFIIVHKPRLRLRQSSPKSCKKMSSNFGFQNGTNDLTKMNTITIETRDDVSMSSWEAN